MGQSAKLNLTPSSAAPSAWGGWVAGGLLLLVLTVLVAEFDKGIAALFKAQGVAQNPLEYPLTAVVMGLIANLVLRVTRLHSLVRPAIRTEL